MTSQQVAGLEREGPRHIQEKYTRKTSTRTDFSATMRVPSFFGGTPHLIVRRESSKLRRCYTWTNGRRGGVRSVGQVFFLHGAHRHALSKHCNKKAPTTRRFELSPTSSALQDIIGWYIASISQCFPCDPWSRTCRCRRVGAFLGPPT